MKETIITITFKHDQVDGTGVLTFNAAGEKISDLEMIGILQTLVNEAINRHNRKAADQLARKVDRDDARQKVESREFLQALKENMAKAEKENAEKGEKPSDVEGTGHIRVKLGPVKKTRKRRK